MTMYEELAKVRKELAAESARADAAESILWDKFMAAVLGGLCTEYRESDGPRCVVETAEKIVLHAILARRRFQAGQSPNAPPRPQHTPMVDMTRPVPSNQQNGTTTGAKK